jgi:hypothetical protein
MLTEAYKCCETTSTPTVAGTNSPPSMFMSHAPAIFPRTSVQRQPGLPVADDLDQLLERHEQAQANLTTKLRLVGGARPSISWPSSACPRAILILILARFST